MEFDVLKDLVRIITRNKVKQIEVLGNPGQEEQPHGRIVRGHYSKERFASDDEAAKVFFWDKREGPQLPEAPQQVDASVDQYIAFFIDVQQPMFSERGKAQYHCYRDYAAAYHPEDQGGASIERLLTTAGTWNRPSSSSSRN
jgi:hypothetical protein